LSTQSYFITQRAPPFGFFSVLVCHVQVRVQQRCQQQQQVQVQLTQQDPTRQQQLWRRRQQQ
jgi:hypothetical protein